MKLARMIDALIYSLLVGLALGRHFRSWDIGIAISASMLYLITLARMLKHG